MVDRLGTPLCYGVPRDRSRLYFLGTCANVLRDARCEQSFYHGIIKEVVSTLRFEKPHQLADVDTFLLEDTHRLIQRQKELQLAQVAAGFTNEISDGHSQWLRRKASREMGTTSFAVSSNWNENLSLAHPSFAVMPERARLLLEECDVSFPGPKAICGKRIFNVSQSEASVHTGYSQCLCPQGVYYLAWKARLIHGLEALNLTASCE